MNGKEYQELAMRTNDGKGTDRLSKAIELLNREPKPECYNPICKDLGGVLNGCLGLAGEAGETLDMVKKWVFHEKELDVEHLKKEIGDVTKKGYICHNAQNKLKFNRNFVLGENERLEEIIINLIKI